MLQIVTPIDMTILSIRSQDFEASRGMKKIQNVIADIVTSHHKNQIAPLAAATRIGYLAVFLITLPGLTTPATAQQSDNNVIAPQIHESDDDTAATTPAGPWQITCRGHPAGCPIAHEASGISVTVPENWSMSEPYFYQTAGGALADLPTTTFFTEDFGNVISVELNPRQWLQSNGPCRTIGASQLCMFSGQDTGADTGFESIASSIRITSP